MKDPTVVSQLKVSTSSGLKPLGRYSCADTRKQFSVKDTLLEGYNTEIVAWINMLDCSNL